MSDMGNPEVRCADGLDAARIAPVFARCGRLHIPGFLATDVATRVHHAMTQETPWSRVVGSPARHHEFPPGAWEALSDQQRAEVERAVHAQGRSGFAYFYENFAVADLHAAGQHLDSYLMRVFEFLNSDPFLEFARRVVGAPGIAFADAQATCYRSGDFLTLHHDDIEGKRRKAAYVLNFSPGWRVDWGGVLQFLDADGHVSEGYAPTFNALNLLRVPQPHAVSYVTPLAGAARYSITGWLRER